ncbi:hypothetical protein Bca4012_092086 [Brassica carinata]
MFDLPTSFVYWDFGLLVGFRSHWIFFFFSGFFSGFLIFVLIAKCGSAFLSRVALAIMEGAAFAEVNGSVVGSVSFAPPAFPLTCSGIGSEGFVGVGAQCRFRPIHCSLSFGGSCPAAGVVVNFLPCSIQIERLGSLEYRTVRCFGGSTSLLTDECLQLDDLRVSFQLGPVFPVGGICCVWDDSFVSLAPVNRVGVTPVLESGPTGSMSLTLEGAVPVVG